MIELLKKKDRKTVEKVYKLYSPVLLAICMRYFKDRDLALDAMHEGFMKALNSIVSFNQQGSFEGWLKRIVVNHAIDLLRKESKNHHEFNEDNHLIEENIDCHSIDKKDIDKKTIDLNLVINTKFSSSEILEEIHKLPQMYCVVFVLFVLDNFSHAQIAEKLNIDEKTSRKRLSRARKMLKELLFEKSISVLGK